MRALGEAWMDNATLWGRTKRLLLWVTICLVGEFFGLAVLLAIWKVAKIETPLRDLIGFSSMLLIAFSIHAV